MMNSKRPIPDDREAELMHAQLAAFTKQVPLLYFILIVNSACLSFTFSALAPAPLSQFLPMGLWLICGIRLVIWTRTRGTALDIGAVARRLQTTVVLGGAIGILFLGWSVLLYPYGTPEARGQLTFFVGITVVSCIFCLMHVQKAALTLTAVIVGPFALYLLAVGEPASWAIAVNLALVMVALVYIVVNASNDFAAMIRNRFDLGRLGEANARLANLDVQTELPNRRQFFTAFRSWIAADGHFALGLIDLDGFKSVNDLHGHAAGDRMMSEMGRRMRLLAGEDVLFARLGGDEFALLVRLEGDEARLQHLGRQLCALLAEPFDGGAFVTRISASTGFAIRPTAGRTEEELYERADYALRRAKEGVRGQFVIFSSHHEDELVESRAVAHCLRSADLDAELSLHFQPLFDAALGRPVGFEALARWQSPELGLVSPSLFIPAAERIGMISDISRVLLRKALAAAHHWPADLWVSFNLSTRDLMSNDAVRDIIAIIHASGIAPARINLEVTESSMMDDFEKARQSLLALKRLGVNISLDDFGTGYSSLSYVHRLPLDKIKVDRSFIQGIECEGRSRNLVKSIIDLCTTLELDCVVEGMETSEQASVLRQLGCSTMQGYFFSKPMPERDVALFLTRTFSAVPSTLSH